MDKINKVKILAKYIKNILIFIAIAVVGYVIFNQNFTDSIIVYGLPIHNIEMLLLFHLISNSLLIISTGFLSYLFFRLYYRLKDKNVPFVGFLWTFGGLKACMCIVFISNLVGILWKSFFWIDGTFRFLSGFFALGALITFYKSFDEIVSIKSPVEYGKLSDEIKRVLDIQQEILQTKLDKDAK